jgi:hypothetical protein
LPDPEIGQEAMPRPTPDEARIGFVHGATTPLECGAQAPPRLARHFS